MDIGNLVRDILTVARTAAAVIPGAPGAIAIGEKVLGLLDDVSDHIPLEEQDAAVLTRAELARVVGAKAKKTAARFQG